jgi:hypothetical protein
MPRFPYLSVIFLLLSALMAAVITPNAARILPPIEAFEADLSARFSGNVKIDGAVRLRFVPRPQIIIEQVSFSDRRRAAQFAANMPQMVINLDIIELVQRRFVVDEVSLIDADVQLQLAGRPAGLLAELHGETLPRVSLLDSDFRIIGLDPLRPQEVTRVTDVSAALMAKQANGPMVIVAQKIHSGGHAAMLRLSIGPTAKQTQIGVTLGLGIDEQIGFTGFLSGSAADWRLDGEVELISSDLLMSAIEARLPMRVITPGRRVQLSGLINGSASGIRADSLEIEALNTVFRSRLALNWPRMQGEMPVLDGRLSTGAVNLDLLRFDNAFDNASDNASDEDKANTGLLNEIWSGIAPDLVTSFDVEATRFVIGGETGSDLVAEINQNGALLSVERLNMNLPFRSSLLATGTLDTSQDSPVLNGNFSTRSSDALALLLWLGNQNNIDFSTFAEALDQGTLQRASMVGDVLFDQNGLALKGLAGRLGDDYFSADVGLPDIAAWRGDVLFRISRFDLADWGILETATAGRESGIVGILPQLDRLLARALSTTDANRDIDFDIQVGQVFAGAQSIGPLKAIGALSNQRVEIQNLRLANFANSDVTLTGALNYDAVPSHGSLSLAIQGDDAKWAYGPIVSRFGPLNFNAAVAANMALDIELTAPGSPDWPKVIYRGTGAFGGASTGLAVTTPSRSLAFVEAGTDIQLSLNGAANALANLLFLPPVYDASDEAAMQLGLNALGNELFSVATNMSLGEDALVLNGNLRDAAGGRLLSGALEFNFAHFLSLLDADTSWERVAASGKMQLNATRNNFGFAGLDLALGDGRISGEGVLQTGGGLPRFNANLATENVDFSWMLTERDKDGWRNEPIRWSLLGRSNADIQLSVAASRFGSVVLDSLNGRLKLTEGVLEAPDLALELFGGTVTASLLAEGGLLSPRFGIDAEFADINPNGFFLQQYGNRLLDAVLSGALRLEGRGTSPRAMMASLGGQINFEIAPGQLTFFDAVGFADKVLEPNRAGLATPLLAAFMGPSELTFTRGLGLAQMRDGVVETASTEFVFANGRNEARLTAALDMVDLLIDAEMKLYPIDSQRPVIWQLTGGLGAPTIKADASAFDANGSAPNAEPQRAE